MKPDVAKRHLRNALDEVEKAFADWCRADEDIERTRQRYEDKKAGLVGVVRVVLDSMET